MKRITRLRTWHSLLTEALPFIWDGVSPYGGCETYICEAVRHAAGFSTGPEWHGLTKWIEGMLRLDGEYQTVGTWLRLQPRDVVHPSDLTAANIQAYRRRWALHLINTLDIEIEECLSPSTSPKR